MDSSDDSDSESSSLLQLSKQKAKGNLDEMVVTAAKEMGKELYAELSLEERKQKLDAMVIIFLLSRNVHKSKTEFSVPILRKEFWDYNDKFTFQTL